MEVLIQVSRCSALEEDSPSLLYGAGWSHSLSQEGGAALKFCVLSAEYYYDTGKPIMLSASATDHKEPLHNTTEARVTLFNAPQ